MLTISNITCRLGDRTLFEGASARVSADQKIGIVGENGSGKTTLLKLITAQIELDGGRIDIQSRCRVGAISQDAPGGDQTPLACVLEADDERTALLESAEVETEPHEIARIHTRLAEIDAHSAPARAAVILAGLGFDQDAQLRPLSSFSGGWRMRVALARALFSAPDLLLLDEPTNHLDLESIMWLESYLLQYPHTLLVVSHDRDLLNRVVDGILYVKDGRLSFFAGGYDAFVRSREATEALAASTVQKQEARRRHLQEFVDRFRAKATKAKQAQSRLKALERMGEVDVSSTSRRIRFDFPSPENRPSPLITLYDVSVGYGSNTILHNLHLSLYPEDRVGLLGANGNGKTTLARLLASTLLPQSGRVVAAGKLRAGYFAQDHLEKLDIDITATEQMRRYMPDVPQERVRAWLGRFGFEQSRAEVRVGQLSGGEKTRLSLALLSAERPNLMILDEPTNHLDMDSRASLVEGLNQFEGAIVLISHDRTLLESTCDQLWRVEGGTCAVFSGDIDDYRDGLLKERSSRTRSSDEDTERLESRGSRRDLRRDAAQARARIAPLKKAAETAEAALEALVAERDAVDAQLSDPAVYSGPADQVASLSRRQRELVELIGEAETQWLEAGEALEEALLSESGL